MVDPRAVQHDQRHAGAVLDVVDRDLADPAVHAATVMIGADNRAR